MSRLCVITFLIIIISIIRHSERSNTGERPSLRAAICSPNTIRTLNENEEEENKEKETKTSRKKISEKIKDPMSHPSKNPRKIMDT